MSFLGGSDYHSDDSSHMVTSRLSGETVQVDVRRRVVDATYLSDDVRVVAINGLAANTMTATGFPCFCAALAGYVEATRDDDREPSKRSDPKVRAAAARLADVADRGLARMAILT